MVEENGNRLHQHSCSSCGQRWYCVKGCLDLCGCIGHPRCMHFPCTKCKSHVGVEHFVTVGRAGNEAE